MFRFIAIVVTAAVCLPGCGSNAPSGPTGSVTGTLTVGGQPVKAGTGIMFMDPLNGTTALGVADEEGNYSLKSFSKSGDSNEFRVGRFSVSVQAPAEDYLDEEDITAEQALEGVTPGLQAPLQFAERYQSIDTSALAFEVVEGENTIDIDLEAN